MRKWIILAVVVVVAGVAGAVALSNLDDYVNENREWIAKQVESAVGRSVSFGEVGVTLWGGLGVRISELRVGDDPSYSPDDFVSVEEASVRVKILPALFGNYQVGRIVLRRPDIRIIQTAGGMNLDSLGGGEEPAPDAESSASPAVLIAFVDIEQGRLTYVDRTGPKPVTLTIEQLDFRATDVSLSNPIEFELSAALLGAAKPNLTGTGRVGPIDTENPEQSDVEVEIRLSALPLDALNELGAVADALPPELDATGAVDLLATMSGTLARMTIHASVDATDSALRYADSFRKADGVPFTVVADGVYAGDVFDLSKAILTLARAEVTAAGQITLGDVTRYDLRITSNDTKLSGWEALLPAVADLGLAGRLSLDVGVKGSTGSEALPALSGSIDLADVAASVPDAPPVRGLTSRITLAKGGANIAPSPLRMGDASLEFDAVVPDLANPSARFRVRSPELSPEKLGLAEPGAKKPDTLRNVVVEGTAKLGASGPTADAKFTSNGGRFQGIDYRALNGTFRYAGTRAVIDALRIEALDGTIDATGSYDMANPDEPTFQLSSKLVGIRIEQLLASRFPAAANLVKGRLNTQLDLSGRGLETEDILRALTGDGEIELNEGVLVDVNLAETILGGITGAPGLTQLISPNVRTRHPALFSNASTAFQTLRGALTVRDGKVHTQGLKLAAADFLLSGTGSVGLDGSLDFVTHFITSPALATSLISSARPVRYLADSAGRIDIPVRLTGTLSNLRAQPDISFVAQSLQRAAFGALTDAALGKLLPGAAAPEPGAAGEAAPNPSPPPADTPNELLRKGLEGLFKR